MVEIRVEFRDPDTLALVTPGAVTATIKPPTGANVIPAVSSPSTGVYVASYPVTVPGVYRYRFSSVAPNQAAAEGSFQVAVSRVL